MNAGARTAPGWSPRYVPPAGWPQVWTVSDITERKRAEAEVIKAKDEAERANQSKSDFLAAMSGEIRTPMNGVLGLIEVLKNAELSEDQRTPTSTIHEWAMTLLTIIDDILDFSKIEAGLGISEENQAKLFQPFRQAESTTTRRFGGTGLGLSIRHRLVDPMDGEIGVRGIEDDGSTFWFTIPVEVVAVAVTAFLGTLAAGREPSPARDQPRHVPS
jgi:signal transduction histidine kinase